jgi:asparagine synthase (glutamine-hydrolysing)
MFRYIALAWDAADPVCLATALPFAKKLQTSPEWRTVLARPGLRVFAAGIKSTINAAYLLSPDQGVILGKLFRRCGFEEPPQPDVVLTARDTAHILQSHGRALVDDYWGRYVALMYDTASGGTRILRDPTGTLPCYLLQHRGVWINFSWLEDVLALAPNLPALAVNWGYLAVHVPSGAMPSRETALSGVTEVLAGEAIALSKGTKTSALYWSAVDIARARIDEDRVWAADRLRSTVRACTQSWASCYGNLMLRLSGGIDSSILVSCLAADSTPARVVCINYHSAGSDSDERAYARLAAAKAQRELVERERDPSFQLERILDVARTPNPSNYIGRMDATRMDVELATEHGTSVLFTGAGGDSLFFEYPTFWSAADYLRTRGLDGGFLSAAMDAARLGRVSVWKALHFALLDRLRLRPMDAQAEVGEFMPLIKPEIVAAARRDRRFVHPTLDSITDMPVSKLTQVRDLMYPLGYYDPFELEEAPELVNPLLSQPVVELCLRLPTYLLSVGGRGRALARQAFAADLPAEIARRRSKGGMEEHIKAILMRNLGFARSLLLDGALVRKGILDRGKLEEVLSGRPTTIASHMTELHTYLGIEAWLNRWSASQQRAAA